MATWWQIAIPTLLGTLVGAGSQLLNERTKGQREHRMRLMDEKINTYGRLRRMLDLQAKAWVERDKRATRSEVLAEEARQLLNGMLSPEQLSQLSDEQRSETFDELTDKDARAEAIKVELLQINSAEDVHGDQIEKLADLMTEVLMWAPDQVVSAASAFLESLSAKDSAEVMAQRGSAVTSAMRNDLRAGGAVRSRR